MTRRVRLPLSLLAGWFLTFWTTFAVADALDALSDNADAAPSGAEAQAQNPPSTTEPPSKAERINRLRQSIQQDETLLKQLRERVSSPNSEFEKADTEFKEIDDHYQERKEAFEALQANGNAEEIQIAESELRSLSRTRELAKERFELAIAERKTHHDKIATLETKIAQQQDQIKVLTGESTPASRPTEPADTASASSPPSGPTPRPEPAPTADATEPTTAPLILPALPGFALPSADPTTDVDLSDPNSSSEELLQALRIVKDRRTALEEAEQRVEALNSQIQILDQRLTQERELLQMARRKIDNADATKSNLTEEIQTKSLTNARAEVLPLLAKSREADDRSRQAKAASREHTDRINQLQAERSELIAQLSMAEFQTRLLTEQLQRAKETVALLQNPFHPSNLIRWATEHGLNIVTIILGMILLRFLARLIGRRMVQLMSQQGMRGTTEEREDRIKTLVGVFENASYIAIIIGGGLMIFQELGVPIGPLMGGAAVFGLAVAFGAQNLIRDYFYGFVILLENQYKLNDVIKIRDIAGQVERITLRMTVLRDLQGCVHFIPNGEITSVSNMTHGWSRALFDIGVAYKEDADRVMELIQSIGKDLRKDPEFAPLILEDLTMLGVDAFGDSAIVIKFFIKTRPLKQWIVKREMLRRIKRTFDDLGIVIPFPHRTVYHVHEHEIITEGSIPPPHLLSKQAPRGLSLSERTDLP